MLRALPPITDPNVLVAVSTSDDAAVYRLNERLALVSTVDFFTPVVDDPYDFGRIAAANALSDIYAMGAQPIYALALVAFPRDLLSLGILERIVKGGADKATEAGCPIVGGHSIDDAEPKYGLSVTGLVDPDRVVKNSGAEPGDRLYLTKPIGTGVIATAVKRGIASDATIAAAVESMATLNRAASEAMVRVGVHSATDVTGFGLVGHLLEMTRASGAGARIVSDQVPLLANAFALAELGAIPGGTRRNMESVDPFVTWADRVGAIQRVLLCDAQTSGGLLIAVAAEKAGQIEAAFRDLAVTGWAIGEITTGGQIAVV